MSLLNSLAALWVQLNGHLQLWLILALCSFDQLDYWYILCIFHFEILPIIRCFQVVRITLPFPPFTVCIFSHVLRHAEGGLMIVSCQATSLVFGDWSILCAFLWVSEAACFWLSKYLLNFLILNVLNSCSLKPQIFFSFAAISSNILKRKLFLAQQQCLMCCISILCHSDSIYIVILNEELSQRDLSWSESHRQFHLLLLFKCKCDIY